MDQGSAGANFAVVIVNYNGGDLLREAVESAVQEGVAAAQVIVVDNGSGDGSDRLIESQFPGLVVIRNGCNAGFARAVNQGLRTSRREFALLLNTDAILQPGALAAFLAAFAAMPRLAIAGGQLRYPDGRMQSAFGPLPTVLEEALPPGVLRRWNRERYRRSTDDTEIRLVESAFGACLAVRTAALAEIGLLDEDFFFYFEEIEWCRRARLRGWQVAFVPQARASHGLGRTTDRFFPAARVEYQRSKLTYYRKSLGRPLYWAASMVMVLRTALNALVYTVRMLLRTGRADRPAREFQAYWHVLAWHALLRPAHWGLPDKCAPAVERATETSRVQL